MPHAGRNRAIDKCDLVGDLPRGRAMSDEKTVNATKRMIEGIHLLEVDPGDGDSLWRLRLLGLPGKGDDIDGVGGKQAR